MKYFSENFSFQHDFAVAKITDTYQEENNIEYICIEIEDKVTKDTIGYASIYLIDINENNYAITDKYAEENTEDLNNLINIIKGDSKNFMFLEKIYIKEKYKRQGIGKQFINGFLKTICLENDIEYIYLMPSPFGYAVRIEDGSKLTTDKLVEYYKNLGFSLLNHNVNNEILMIKAI